MKFELVKQSAKFIERQDRVVEFKKTDLPAPGSGFEGFFKAISPEGQLSEEAFDDVVIKVYGR
jgi:hypothetical protein